MTAIVSPLGYFLALVLIGAGGHKLLASDRLVAATGRLLRLVPPLARCVMFAAAAVEGAAAIALLLPASRPLGAVIAALLWSFYAIALSAARLRGDGALDCGCSFAVHRRGIDTFAPIRAVGLALLAGWVALSSGAEAAFEVESLFAALALFSLFLAAGELAALPSLRGSSIR